MVNCAIVGCSSDSSKHGRNNCSFHKLPTIIKHQGPQMVEITTERRRVWLSVISRDDLPCLENVYVCSNHFESGKCYKCAQVSEEDTGCVFVNDAIMVLKLIKECYVTVKWCKQLHLRLVMLGFRQMTRIFSMRRFFCQMIPRYITTLG